MAAQPRTGVLALPQPRPELTLRGRRHATFGVCAVAGLAAGCSAHLLIGALYFDAPWVALATMAAGALTAFLFATAASVRAGAPNLVFAHLGAATLTGVIGAAAVAGEPVGRWMAATCCGLLVLDAVGRVGCHHTGCCIGRPSHRGVRYDTFTVPDEILLPRGTGSYLPSQLLEGAGAALLACLAIAVLVGGAQPDEVVGLIAGGYGVLRLAVELTRAHDGRAMVGPLVHGVVTAYALTVAGAAVIGPAPLGLAIAFLGLAGLAINLLDSARTPALKEATR